MSEKKILCVGLACLDIIMVCKSYPKEDSDQRGLGHRWHRGGNASNNCTVLSAFGAPCEYLGTVGDDHAAKFMRQDFLIHGINIDHCVIHHGFECPTSVVIINDENGSRTILHSNRNMPELMFEDFKNLPLKDYKWIHFEGRNVSEVKKMFDLIAQWNTDNPNDYIKTSVEIEKPNVEMKDLLECADVTFISKDFAQMRGYKKMEDAVLGFQREIKQRSMLICPWGEKGACAKEFEGPVVSSPAYSPPKVVDTCCAGDTFVATSILSLSKGRSLLEAITFGCKVSGAKCGQSGLDNLKNIVSTFE